MKIVIIDYGCGNILSVKRALEKIGFDSAFSRDPIEISEATHIILPGVGAFGYAMSLLSKYKLVETIKKHAFNKKPLLGICLGMQLLLSKSSEFGNFEGLNLIKGTVKNISKKNNEIKVPHIGWNTIKLEKQGDNYGFADNKSFYFVHSFIGITNNPNSTLAFTNYEGIKIPAIIKEENITGFQFHPEKSHYTGLELIKNFCND